MGRGLRVLAVALAVTCALAAQVGLVRPGPAMADPPLPRIATGWMPYWFTTPKAPQGIANAVANADVLTEVSPFWYSAVKGGPAGVRVIFNPNFTDAANNAGWSMAQLRAAGLSVLPAIADGSGKGTMAAVLANPATRSAHVADIVNLVMTNGYDGIDLDYEQFAFADGRSTWASTQPNWTAFVTELGAALKAQGKLLSVTIPGPCSTTNVCGGTNGYWVYDMAGIAPAADRIRIMTYDFHYNAPGAIAPIGWVTTTAQYAASIVPASKVVIGIPAYARSWTLKTGSQFRLSGTCPTSGSAYRQLTAMASTTAAQIGGVLASVGADPAAVQVYAATAGRRVEYDKPVTWTDGSGAQ
ncbi:MAG: glycosyl hydrolase family 18 protein, partial [Actinomycetales bacterium]